MKKIAAVGIWVLLLTADLRAQAPAEVMLIGTRYLPADLYGPARQLEAEALAAQLAAFAPDAIVVEAPGEPGDDARMQAAYAAFREGLQPAARSTRDQLAFRLAARLDHEQIQLLYTGRALPLSQALESAAADPAAILALARWLREQESRRLDQMPVLSIPQYLAALNDSRTLASTASELARLLEPLPAAARYWNQYHLGLARQIRTLAAGGQRLVVFLDIEHAPLVRSLLAGDPKIRLADPVQYLQAQ
ncbi:MAG: DUF5694 domain-containing protein [Bacteroidia bacterium]|nr:DUF5694 domain-containing protein [Bacteroidia bacterium]